MARKRMVEKKREHAKSLPKLDNERIYAEFIKPVMKSLEIHARRIAGNEEFAKDLLQEAEMKILKEAKRWNPKIATKKKFALTVGVRRMTLVLRREIREKRKEILLGLDATTRRILQQRERKSPSGPVLAREELTMVKQAFDGLKVSKEIKDTFIFFLGSGKKPRNYRVVAEHFGVSVGIVKNRIFKVRKALREALEAEGRH